MAGTKLYPKIITFKKKDQRQDRKLDKLQILKKHIKTRMEFCDIVSLQEMASIPLTFDGTPVGHDINAYDLPIISGSFTDKEIKSIKSDVNVELVEDDLIAHAMPMAQPIAEQATPLEQKVPISIEDVPSTAKEVLPWGINRIDSERAWNVTRGAGIRVAVIDTGIDAKHQDLRSNIAGGVSFVPGESYMDGNGHGTHVAGIIGASQSGSGVIGVAPNCNLSRGHQIDLTAPGVNILSTLPGNRYGIKNGTSMAAPHVAGAAALAISSHRFTPVETIRMILLQSADDLGITGRDNEYGQGLVDVEQAAFMRQLH